MRDDQCRHVGAHGLMMLPGGSFTAPLLSGKLGVPSRVDGDTVPVDGACLPDTRDIAPHLRHAYGALHDRVTDGRCDFTGCVRAGPVRHDHAAVCGPGTLLDQRPGRPGW